MANEFLAQSDCAQVGFWAIDPAESAEQSSTRFPQV